MSYCRWSSDNWKSDLYCYEDVAGGWTTHVAGRRRTDHDRMPQVRMPTDWNDDKQVEVWMADESRQSEWLDKHRDAFEPIGLPHAGETFNDATIEEFLERVRGLKVLGYHVPEGVEESILEEMGKLDPPSPSR